MQLVRTAQPKHKINLLSLSTEAGGPDVGHLVCSINSMQFVRTAQFKHKHLLALYSHSPRRTGGPLRPRKTQRVNSTTPRSRRFLKSFPIFSNRRHVFRRLCPIRGPFIALRQCRRRVNSTTPRSRFLSASTQFATVPALE